MGTLRTGVTNRNSPVRGGAGGFACHLAPRHAAMNTIGTMVTTRRSGVVQLLQFQGTTWSREIFVGFGPPTGRQLSFSRGITSEKVEPCTEPPPSLPRPVRRPR